jgi:hypothetical protein
MAAPIAGEKATDDDAIKRGKAPLSHLRHLDILATKHGNK